MRDVCITNIRLMLCDLLDDIEGGLEVRGMELSEGLLEILSDTDGCSAQYRCGTALFLLQKLAVELNIIYDRSIDVEGHGKRKIDGYTGSNKTTMTKAFCCNVEYQPENMKDVKKSFLLYQMSDGERTDLADICCKILNEADRRE